MVEVRVGGHGCCSMKAALAMGTLCVVLALLDHPARVGATQEVMTNQWLVQLNDHLGDQAARLVAKRNGFAYVSPVSSRFTYII